MGGHLLLLQPRRVRKRGFGGVNFSKMKEKKKIKMRCSGTRGEEMGVLNTKALICLIWSAAQIKT